MGVNCLSHPIVYDATVQATIMVSSFTDVTCLGHPIFYGANCSNDRAISLIRVLTVWATLFRMVLTVHHGGVVTCYVSISHPLFMVLTVRASVTFLPSGGINVWGTAILFISLQVYNNYKLRLINYSILKLHPQIFLEAQCPHILHWGFILLFYIGALSSQFILRLCPHRLFWNFVLGF